MAYAVKRDNSVRRYQSFTDNYPILSEAQEIELVLKMREGDEKAKETLILSNMRLVMSYARRYSIRINPTGRLDPDDYMDLAQEGTVGLMTALEKFDLSQNCTFSTYATWWIKQSISRAIENDVISRKVCRTPSHFIQEVARLERLLVKYHTRDGNEIDEEEFYKESGRTVQLALNMVREKNRLQRGMSLDTKMRNDKGDGDTELYEVIPDSFQEARIRLYQRHLDLEKVINDATSVLTPEDRELALRRFAQEETLEQLGERFNVTRERIRQKEAKILKAIGGYIILFYPEIAEEFSSKDEK